MQTKKITYAILVLCLSMLACLSSATPVNTSPTEEPNASTISTETSLVVVDTSSPAHQIVPNELPELQSGTVGDQDSSVTASENRASSGDRFTFSRYERPFNANSMDTYYPYLDIQGALLYEDNTWLYGVLVMKNDETSQSMNGKYGFEIDLNIDGDGDYLILANQPSSKDWVTTGVEVWFDENDDVGGEVSTTTDANPVIGNGYETLLSDDPDLAFARISPTDPYTVQIAVKRALLQGDDSFLVGMWAGNQDLDPASFEMNDHITHEQAGSSLVEFEFFYPIKELSEIDNTCRMAIGFQPIGNEAGLCPLPEQEEQGCPPQYYVCRNISQIAVVIVCYCNQP
jgi:hypothetical protein